MQDLYLEEEGVSTSSFLSREVLVWKLQNYSKAYLSRPKRDWPVYEFCYRSVLREMVDDLVERIRKEERKITEIVADMEQRCDKAIEEPNGEVYKIYRDAIRELYDIVSDF